MAVITSLAPGYTAHLSDDELVTAYQDDGDQRARDELVQRYIPFARKLALRYSYTEEPLDDLVQVACLGLLKAIDRFDTGRGHRFTSFAVPTVLGEIKRHFRDKGWAVHVPRTLQERALLVSRESDRLSSKLGRSPTLRELAAAVGCSEEEALEATEVAHNYHIASLDAPAAHDGDEPSELGSLLGGNDDRYELVESREAIAESWHSLTELERRVVALRFAHDLTQREIAEQIGYSQMHVSRLLRRSLKRLISAPENA